MNKAIQILTAQLEAMKAERARLEYEITKEIEPANIQSRERMLGKLRIWIVDVEEGIAKLNK